MTTIFVPDDFYCPITGNLMSDPVSEPDGHTYERYAIIKWLSKNNTSPMTRGGLCVRSLKENIALKKSIDSIREKLSEEQLKKKSKLLEEDLKVFNQSLEGVEVKTSIKDNHLIVSTYVPNVETRPPVDMVLCLDISGSMGSDAPVKGGDGSSTSYGITLLSLTISAAKTILKTLNEKDNITIVTYSTEANILFTDCECIDINKETIETDLDNLKPTGTTNMWAGIKKSLDVLKFNSPKDKLKVIKLFTDGLPSTEPNRGYGPEIQKYFDDNDFKCMINCYGFGYSLKSEILSDISNVSGGDGFSYVPDSSLLGNIFIHGVSNFFTTAATFVKAKIVFTDGSWIPFEINSLKYGQTKNVVIEIGKEVSHVEMNIIGNIIKSEITDITDDKYYEQLYRYKTYNMMDGCITMKKFNDPGFKTTLDNLILEITFNKDMKDNKYIQNILYDLEGQVKEALNMTSQGEREDWFSKWGIHYLRSLKTAYKNEVCNNFKDKGVSNFSGELFEKLRDEVSDIFDSMPPPKREERTVYGSSGMRGGGYQFGSAAPLQPLATMASYNVASGGCCARGCRIRMEDNSFKKVEDLNIGDEVITVDIKDGKQIYQTGKIDSVIVTSCNGGRANMVSLRNLKITPYHPIISFNNTDEWVYPKDLGLIKTIKCSEMYTFVINNRQSVLIEDFIFSTFGHGLDSNEVIQHNYFGSESVIEDLSKIITDPYGKIRLIPEMFVRGGNGKVCSIKYSWKYHNFMNVFYHASL